MNKSREDEGGLPQAGGITIKFTVPGEVIEWYKIFGQWQTVVPTIYFLDINVASLTKKTAGDFENSPKKRVILERMRELDKPHNCFSYMLGLMEKISDSRGKNTCDGLRANIIGDLLALRSFFQYARIAESDELALEMLEVLREQPIELDRSNYLKFMRFVNNELSMRNKVGAELRLDTAGAVVDAAITAGVQKKHPVVLLVLACIYGNKFARSIFKFKENPEKFDAENALADIMLISRVAELASMVIASGSEGGAYVTYDFLTGDDGLPNVLACFKLLGFRVNENEDEAGIEYKFDVDLIRLWPESARRDREKIIALLNKESDDTSTA
ncbi:hypothetical protein ABFU38_05145 [Xanthomonas campestris pv. raphani]|uniref:hypothetical protein n=1 Tax=Xanthomonas campestris TaxID=339 RepID=UPI0038903D5F